MSGETASSKNQQPNPQTDQWQSLIQDGIYGLDKKPTEEYLNSEAGQKAIATVEEFNQKTKNLDYRLENLEEQVAAGALTDEQAQKYRDRFNAKKEEALTKAIDQIDDYRQDFIDSQSVGTPEEEERYQRWLQSHDAENMDNLEARGATYRTVDDASSNKTSESETEDDEKQKKAAAEQEEKEATEAEEKEKDDAAEAEQEDNQEAEQEEDIEKEQHSDEEIEKLEGNLAEAERRLQEEEAEKATAEKLETLKTELGSLRSKLAELAARNRRLFVGSKNRAAYHEAIREYKEKLDEYLRIADKAEYNKGIRQNKQYLQAKFDARKEDIEAGVREFAGGDLENTDKTPEEIEAERQRLIKLAKKMLDTEYDERKKELRTRVNATHLERYLEQENLLWDATNDRVDNGSLCRKAVSKILTNKYFKGALIGAAAVGLAVTGVGLAAGIAAGTTAVGFGLGAGTAVGAAKGGLSALLMSRQSSKNSALNATDRLTRDQAIRAQLANIDFLARNDDAAKVNQWMIDQYDSAIQADRASNVKRTAISVGIGAVAGAIMGSLQFNATSTNASEGATSDTTSTANTAPATETKVVGYDVSENLKNINVSEGSGMHESLSQMGVAPENIDRAIEEFAFQLDPKYGLSPGSNGAVPGFDGLVGKYAHTYPGEISGWPDVVQSYYEELAQVLAKEGLIEANPITIEIPNISPIFNTLTEVSADAVPNAFEPFLDAATEWIPIAAGAIPAGAIATRQNRPTPVEAPQATPEPTPESNETSATEQPEQPEQVEQAEQSEQQPTQETEPTESDTSSEQTPAEPEQGSTEQAGETTDQELRDLITNRLGDILSAEDIDILSMPVVSSEDERSPGISKIANWWGSLDDGKKDAIRQLYQDEANESITNNSLFKTFLSTNESAAPQIINQ